MPATSASSPAPTAKPSTPSLKPIVRDNRVEAEAALDPAIHVIGVKSTIGAGGFLRLQLDVQNASGAVKQFNYQIEWYARDGIALPMADTTPLSWLLLPHETANLAVTAPTPSALDFRIILTAPASGLGR